MTHAIDVIIFIILTLANLVMAFIAFVDSLLSALMTSAGIPPNAQAILLVAVAILLVILAVRALGGLFGTLIVVLLVLLMLHALFPKLTVPQGHTPDWLHTHQPSTPV